MNAVTVVRGDVDLGCGSGALLSRYLGHNACDSLNPSTSDCTNQTGTSNNTLHTNTRTFDFSAFPDNTNANNRIGYRRGSSVLMLPASPQFTSAVSAASSPAHRDRDEAAPAHRVAGRR